MKKKNGRDLEKRRAKNARYWERHKDEINARRRERYAAQKNEKKS